MKKVLAVAVISLGLTLPATAQFTQGKILATGGIQFTTGSMSLEDDSTSSETMFSTMTYGVNVGGGYFFADNMAAGIRLGYNSATITADPDGDTPVDLVATEFNWGVFGRYYMPYSDRFAMFGELGVGMANISETIKFDGDSEDVASGSAFSVGLGVGMNYMVSDMIFLEMNYGFLGYTSLSMTDEMDPLNEKTTTSEFGLMGDLSSVSLGVTLLF